MRLSNYLHFIINGPNTINELSFLVGELSKQNRKLGIDLTTATKKMHILEDKLSEIRNNTSACDAKIVDALSQLDRMNSNPIHTPKLFVNNHSLEKFYVGLEKYFRGSEKEIKDRQAVYLPRLKSLNTISPTKPVVDIGCGRGEFLELMREEGIDYIGIDLNKEMVLRARRKGLIAEQADAVKWLDTRGPATVSAITGFHIIEHIPFEILITVFTACHRSLVQDGFVLFETPNPENLNVGANSFWIDPSHLRPLPPAMLEYTLKFCGFKNTEILRLHPLVVSNTSADSNDLSMRIYGPQDYAVIAYK